MMNLKILLIFCLQLSTGLCGKIKRILNGQNADIDEYPYMASLRYITPHYHFCGGAIISNVHILTAAHCVYDKEMNNIRVYTGTSKIEPTSGYARVVIRIEIHYLFESSPKSNNDIAVITVKKSIKFNRFQNKIDLPTRDIRDKDNAIITGWGKTSYSLNWSAEVLQKGLMKIMNINDCREFVKIHLYDEQICAYSIEYGVHTSSGDSGGPLVANGKIVGISSCNFPLIKDYPDIYTNVFFHLSFIKYATKNNVYS